MTSGAFTAAYQALVPEFERITGHHVISIYGASMGIGPTTIPSRLERHETADIVILADASLADLVISRAVWWCADRAWISFDRRLEWR